MTSTSSAVMGSFRNVLGDDETWLEPWQSGGGDRMLCSTCGTATMLLSPRHLNTMKLAQTLTINGQGSYMGLTKGYQRC